MEKPTLKEKLIAWRQIEAEMTGRFDRAWQAAKPSGRGKMLQRMVRGRLGAIRDKIRDAEAQLARGEGA